MIVIVADVGYGDGDGDSDDGRTQLWGENKLNLQVSPIGRLELANQRNNFVE